MYSLGFRKDFKNKKGSFGLSAENFFTEGGVIKNTLNSAFLTQNSITNLYNRGVRVNIAYKFGKMGFEQKKKTRSVKNDDLKDGGGEDGGGDGGGGAAQPQGGGRPQNGAGKPTDAKPSNGAAPKQDMRGGEKPESKDAPKKDAPKKDAPKKDE